MTLTIVASGVLAVLLGAAVGILTYVMSNRLNRRARPVSRRALDQGRRTLLSVDLGDGTTVTVQNEAGLLPVEAISKLTEAVMRLEVLAANGPSMKKVPPAVGGSLTHQLVAQTTDAAAIDAIIPVLLRSDVCVLGHPGAFGDSDILHYTIENREYLPLFSEVSFVNKAFARHPQWRDFELIDVGGRSLVASTDERVTLVINPWSRLELEIPAAQARGYLVSRPW